MNQKMEELHDKAMRLPLSPGVYIMKNRSGTVIYVGKSKALRNRVSQYFAPGVPHDVKTTHMAESVYDFDYMLTDSEMEALTLENKLIKLHQPKFNIRLKDAKSYPYLKVSINEPYPRITVVRSRTSDGARYFGPYSGTGAAYAVLKTVQKLFGIAVCRKEFPRDIGKERPCLYHQMGQCPAPCSGKISSEQYREVFGDVLTFLRGSFDEVKRSLEKKMLEASDELRFEAAAIYRDRIQSLATLWQRQKVVGSPDADQDVFALYTEERCSCLAVFYVRSGCVIDSEHFIFSADQIASGESIIGFIGDLYVKRGYIPKEILFGFAVSEEDQLLLGEYLTHLGGRARLRFPERGDLRRLCQLVEQNAKEFAEQYLTESERDNRVLIRLAEVLSLEVVPEHIEAIDISNMGSENIVAGLICVRDGKLFKSGYRTYNITDLSAPNDYAAMREAVMRRLRNASPADYPDLLLLDGGKGHVSTIRALLREMNIDIPVYGMVKDDYHKTRALTGEDADISIAREQSVFTFIYKIQEEVHRFTITRMSNAKRKTLRTSSLEAIDGIGEVKARALLEHFRSLRQIREADAEELRQVRGISARDAENIIAYFQNEANKRKDG